jgi:enoyl-CoA hydratase/carnithine racemase
MDIQTEISNGLMTITLNRPKRKNSFSRAMYAALGDAFCDATHNKAVKVILIKGQKNCFSAGNDLSDFLDCPPPDFDSPVFRFLRLIAAFPKPIVAQVQGVAIGIGTSLLLHCDLVYAESTAKFSMPFVKLGLCPEAASSLLLPLLAGYQKAAELLLLGDLFSASKACSVGIVSDVIDSEKLENHVQQQVNQLLDLPFPSLLVTKRLMKSVNKVAVSQQLFEEGKFFTEMIRQPAAQEAFMAFGEKRTPNFKQFEN